MLSTSTPEAKPHAQGQTDFPKPNHIFEEKSMPDAGSICVNPQRKDKPMPEAGAICPDPERISKTTNKRAPESYPNNKGSIKRVWRAAPFSTGNSLAMYISGGYSRDRNPLLLCPQPVQSTINSAVMTVLRSE